MVRNAPGLRLAAVLSLLVLCQGLAVEEANLAKEAVASSIASNIASTIASGRKTQKEAAPVPENVQTVHHQKFAGAGYAAGSPLFEKQQAVYEGTVLREAHAHLGDQPLKEIVRSDRVSMKASAATRSWLAAAVITSLLLQLLMVSVALWYHHRFLRKGPSPLDRPGSAQALSTGTAPPTSTFLSQDMPGGQASLGPRTFSSGTSPPANRGWGERLP